MAEKRNVDTEYLQRNEAMRVQAMGQTVAASISRVIVGKAAATRLLLVALLSEGHVLLEDVPGVGKTMLARTAAVSLGCLFQRIQFTPDLLPSDVTGVSVFDQKQGDFVFRPGPIAANLVLADEINRATPRTQSSLLECMAEGQVTVDGITRPLPKPFMVLATQNPVEYEGTFPLPEAQLDRFFLRLSLGYPDFAEEMEVLSRLRESHPIDSLAACVRPEKIVEMQGLVRKVYVEPSVAQYIVRLVHATRGHRDIQLGASPRASLALMRGGQAMAALAGREYVIPDDVKALAVPVLSHRVVLRPEAQLRGISSENLIQGLMDTVPVEFEENLVN